MMFEIDQVFEVQLRFAGQQVRQTCSSYPQTILHFLEKRPDSYHNDDVQNVDEDNDYRSYEGFGYGDVDNYGGDGYNDDLYDVDNHVNV